jgi:hypothetical protein
LLVSESHTCKLVLLCKLSVLVLQNKTLLKSNEKSVISLEIMNNFKTNLDDMFVKVCLSFKITSNFTVLKTCLMASSNTGREFNRFLIYPTQLLIV